ncbi:PREDICTED: glycerol-3-phosphate acyltransferase 4-like, partial [Rhagoletis zephyria]|uniref:glycerol-3-phosphate acyltransferase 4-like n=1 Tax=Rhagoletis zephyria TaxID=28612 RepID=UPI0008118DC1
MIITTTFLVALFSYLGLASVGHKFFIHQFYVTKLLQLFEYGNRRVKKVNERMQQSREQKRKLSLIKEGQAISKPEPDDVEIESESETDSAYGEELEYDRNNIQASTYQGRTRSASLGLGEQKHELDLFAVSDFARAGIQSIVDDQVTKRFAAKELQTWNLLTRTDKFYHYKSLRLAAIWLTGAFFRYFILFPFRAIITIVGVLFLIAITGLIGLIFPEGPIKKWVYYSVSIMCFRMCSRGFSGVITYHNPENKARGGGICVANHTSPIDVVILHCDNSYALVGQKQGGFLGIMQRALARAADH